MELTQEKLETIYSNIADLTKRVEALEQAIGRDAKSKSEDNTYVGESVNKALEKKGMTTQREDNQLDSGVVGETDLLQKYVESRKEIVKGDDKKEWVPDGEKTSETDSQPLGKQPFRYDTPIQGKPIFTVYKYASLYETLRKFGGRVRSSDDRLEIVGAYPLLKCRQELLAMKDKTPDEGVKIELEVMAQLYNRKPDLITVKKHHDELLHERKTDYDGLEGLFSKGQLVVFRELRDEWAVARVQTFSMEPYDDSAWLECEAIDFDGNKFRSHLYRKSIDAFVGTKNITELEVYPLFYHPDKEMLINISKQSGGRWHALHMKLTTENGQPKSEVMQYAGYCETFTGYDDGIGREISGRVIIDPTRFPDRDIKFSENDSDPFNTGPFSEKLEDDPLVLCPERVLVYSLSDNEWYYVAMRKLEYPRWIPRAWELLVKPKSTSDAAKSIERIRLLSAAHTSADHDKELDKTPDYFQGKGKGLTFLLHGLPGIGKTMLAECLSEEHRRPLYRVNLGMLISSEQWESKIEEIFRQAHFWGAILLIDEAEVVMSERTPESMRSSAWVAVFLRKVEYFEGILFLTTNQIHMIDPAFISRVNLGMAFPELDFDTRLQIWKKILGHPNYSDKASSLLSDDQSLKEWARKDLNGRQIRNVIYSARLLAKSGESQLKKEHIVDCLNDVTNFMSMINKEKDREKTEYMSSWS